MQCVDIQFLMILMGPVGNPDQFHALCLIAIVSFQFKSDLIQFFNWHKFIEYQPQNPLANLDIGL